MERMQVLINSIDIIWSAYDIHHITRPTQQPRIVIAPVDIMAVSSVAVHDTMVIQEVMVIHSSLCESWTQQNGLASGGVHSNLR